MILHIPMHEGEGEGMRERQSLCSIDHRVTLKKSVKLGWYMSMQGKIPFKKDR